MGLSAEIELNANIKKLQLGCGGSNNSIRAGCDIDIDNLSLSGIPEAGQERPETSAKLTNPFIEFAIKNPTSAATREVMGFRVSAEKNCGVTYSGNK